MVIHPNKPIIFGIDHDAVLEAFDVLPKFKQLLLRKKTLFIELTAEELSHLLEYPNKVKVEKLPCQELLFSGPEGVYRRFAQAALQRGLQVIPLDKKKVMDRWWSTMFNSKRFTRDYVFYQNLNKRENAWEELLKTATSKAIVVMHPDHAKHMMTVLKIPHQNVAYLGNIRDKEWILDARPAAERYAKRIAQERLARRQRSAQQKEKRRLVKKH
ncbi:MAG: hypothetical protein NTY48_05325 [Candidatus Diapherotrites archaeon]|nr:hypothetical protein [Candidatus Diapherotrites archaeon]